jgi:competence protein ComEC
MPALLLLVLLLVSLLAGCVPGSARSDGVPSADAPFTLTALDVGQGDAILLRTRQVAVLIDTGDPEAGVVRKLRREGVERLDLLVITHAHLDHVGGAPAVLAALPVGVVWMHPVPDGVRRRRAPDGAERGAAARHPGPWPARGRERRAR